jgi:hypothetical protein
MFDIVVSPLFVGVIIGWATIDLIQRIFFGPQTYIADAAGLVELNG